MKFSIISFKSGVKKVSFEKTKNNNLIKHFIGKEEKLCV